MLSDPTAAGVVAFERTVGEFLDFFDLNGWQPAFHRVPPSRRGSFKRRGYASVMIGRNEVIRLGKSAPFGKSMRSLRSTRNHTQHVVRSISQVPRAALALTRPAEADNVGPLRIPAANQRGIGPRRMQTAIDAEHAS